jgi:nucleotide-binding universal stress UspA family protein
MSPERSRSGLRGPVLLATDGSPDAANAAQVAAQLTVATGPDLHVAHAWFLPAYELGPISSIGYHPVPIFRDAAQSVLDRVAKQLRRKGVPVSKTHLLQGRPADSICDLARELNASMIVIGSRGLGRLPRVIVGSVSEGVVHDAPCPVLVCRGGQRAWPPVEMVAGDDGSPEAAGAAETAAILARSAGVRRLRLLWCQPVAWQDAESAGEVRRFQDRKHRVEAQLRQKADRLGKQNDIDVYVDVEAGEPASTLIKTANQPLGPALIAVGSRGLGAVRRMALGSVSTKVLRAAPGMVLISPHHEQRQKWLDSWIFLVGGP